MHSLYSMLSLICLLNLSGLNVGDRAPSLEGTLWLKGGAPGFERRYTVVEFWATWCSSCRTEVSHLTKLQDFYGDSIVIVGLSSEPSSDIARYLKEMGEAIGYGIGKVTEDLRAKYMTGADGMPHVFLVNPDGVVIWGGHPMDLDEILDKALAGTLDLERIKRIAGLEKSLKETLKSNNLDTVGQAADALLFMDPAHERALQVRGVVAKRRMDTAAFRTMYDRIDVPGLGGEKANRLAWDLVTEKELPFRYLKAALKLAAHSVKLEPLNGSYAATYARIQYCLGNIREAITWQKRATRLDPEDKIFEATLQYYIEVERLGKERETG